MIDVKVGRTDAGCELRYLPQATEEDRGAHLFKARAGIGALAFVAAATSVLARGVTTWRRVMKNTTLLVAVLALASALACESADASTYDVSFSLTTGGGKGLLTSQEQL